MTLLDDRVILESLDFEPAPQTLTPTKADIRGPEDVAALSDTLYYTWFSEALTAFNENRTNALWDARACGELPLKWFFDQGELTGEMQIQPPQYPGTPMHEAA